MHPMTINQTHARRLVERSGRWSALSGQRDHLWCKMVRLLIAQAKAGVGVLTCMDGCALCFVRSKHQSSLLSGWFLLFVVVCATLCFAVFVLLLLLLLAGAGGGWRCGGGRSLWLWEEVI
jgi:hypothetical protein